MENKENRLSRILADFLYGMSDASNTDTVGDPLSEIKLEKRNGFVVATIVDPDGMDGASLRIDLSNDERTCTISALENLGTINVGFSEWRMLKNFDERGFFDQRNFNIEFDFLLFKNEPIRLSYERLLEWGNEK